MAAKVKIFMFAGLLFLGGIVSAGDAGRESLFITGAGARSLGMGGGFTAIADDAAAIFYNPAGLASLSFQELSFMHMTLFQGTRYNYLAWVYPTTELGGFGVAVMRVGTDDIIRRNNFVDAGSFDYSQLQILLSYGKRLHPRVSFGLNAKIVNQSFDRESDYGVGLDAGLKADFGNNFSFGIITRDLIPAELKVGTSEESLPTSVVGGLALKNIKIGSRTKLLASMDLEKTEDRSLKLHAGAEAFFNKAYALRFGYDRDNFAFGAGYRYRRLKVDYAYKMLDYVDDSHRFSFSYLLGMSIDQQHQQVQQRSIEVGSQLISDERRKQFEFFKEKGNEHYYKYRLDSALAYFHRAQAFDESNREIIGTIAAIEEAIRFREERRSEIALVRQELVTSLANYMSQARNFFVKKYYSAALDMLGLVIDMEQNNREALDLKKEIEKAISTEISDNFEAARLAEKDERHLAAVEAYSRILELEPANQLAARAKARIGSRMDLDHQLNKGIGFYKQGKYPQARKRFRAVLAIESDHQVAHEYLAMMAPTPDKVTTLEVLQKNKTIWQHYVNGLRHMRNREYQKAIESWQKVLKVYPNSIDTRNNLEQARLLLKSEK